MFLITKIALNISSVRVGTVLGLGQAANGKVTNWCNLNVVEKPVWFLEILDSMDSATYPRRHPVSNKSSKLQALSKKTYKSSFLALD